MKPDERLDALAVLLQTTSLPQILVMLETYCLEQSYDALFLDNNSDVSERWSRKASLLTDCANNLAGAEVEVEEVTCGKMK